MTVRAPARAHLLSLRMRALSASSSDVNDEEAERLRSVAVDSASVAGVAAALSQSKRKNNKKRKDNSACSEDDVAPSSLKFYQARARDHLHEYLDKAFNIKFVKYEDFELPDDHVGKDVDNTGFHLFRRAPSGLSDKSRHQQVASSTRKRKLYDPNLDEDSEMFQARLLDAAIDGPTLASYAEKEKAKAFTSWMLHQAKENEAERKEEERVAHLKLQRGEQWLPSVAKDMELDSLCGSKSRVRVADGKIYRERMQIKS